VPPALIGIVQRADGQQRAAQLQRYAQEHLGQPDADFPRPQHGQAAKGFALLIEQDPGQDRQRRQLQCAEGHPRRAGGGKQPLPAAGGIDAG